jgi:NAD(P)-dependent dehydrogenase (short-subunit alcohol dehydrogenase family)
MARLLEGRTCLVTGATSGIGQETALGLAREGARVLIVGRDRARGEAARRDVAERSGNSQIELLLADLASLREVARLADEVRARCGALHVLVNNAGVTVQRRSLTVDGLETTFAVNHLSYFALTLQLLDLLRAGAPARVVNVASDAHRFGAIDWDDLQSERRYQQGLSLVAAMRVYGTSKLMNILFTRELAARLERAGVTANCVHPGMVATRLGTQQPVGRVMARLIRPFAKTPAQGADTSVYLSTAPELAAVSGRYFARRRELTPSRAAQDGAAARRLWETSLSLAGLRDPLP